MADNDLELHVKTTADLTALKAAQDELERFYGSAHPGEVSRLSAPIPAELLKPGGAFGEGTAGYEGLTHAAAEAQRFGINLARARNEAVTLVRELAAGAPVTRTLGALLGSLGYQITGLALAVGAPIAIANKAIEEEQRRQDEAAKQLDNLIVKTQEWARAAQEVKTPEDLLKLGEKIGPEIDASREKLKKVAEDYPSLWKRSIDSVIHELAKVSGVEVEITGPFAALHEAAITRQGQLTSEVETTAQKAFHAGQAFKEAFERRERMPLADALADINKEVTRLNAQLANTQDIKSANIIAAKIEAQVSSIKELASLDKDRQEIRTKELGSLDTVQDKIGRIIDDLRSMGVHAHDPLSALDEMVGKTNAEQNAIRSLALQWANLAAQRVKTLESDLSKGPQTAFMDSLHRQVEFQKQIAAQRELAAEGIGKEVSAAEKKKFFAEDELEQLRRTQALQRSLVPEGEDIYGKAGAERLGKQGMKEFLEREERIRELMRQQRQPEAPKPPAPTSAARPTSQQAQGAADINAIANVVTKAFDATGDKMIHFFKSIWQ